MAGRSYSDTPESSNSCERRYRSLMENASDGIVIFNEEARCLEANIAAQTMLGYSQSEITGMTAMDVMPIEDLRNDPLDFDKLKSGQTVRKHRRLIRKDGSIVSAEISANQIEPGMYLVALRDVTDRVNAQRIQQTVYDLASKLARADALEQIYEYALDALQSAMNVKRASIVLMDPDQMPVCAAHRGLSEQFCSLVEPRLDGQSRNSGDEARPIAEAVVIENVGQSSLHSDLFTPV